MKKQIKNKTTKKTKILSLIAVSILTLAIISAIVSHNANQIWVSVNGIESTLEDAVVGDGLCSFGTSSYSFPKPNPGHYASELEISSGKSLQQVIDEAGFCGASAGYCVSRNCGPDTCGGYCGPNYNSCPTGQVCQSGSCITLCTDTCTSLEYTCGTHTICGVSTSCGGDCDCITYPNPTHDGMRISGNSVCPASCNQFCIEKGCPSGGACGGIITFGEEVPNTWYMGVDRGWVSTIYDTTHATSCICG